MLSLYSGGGAGLGGEAVEVPAALQPFGTEEELRVALEAARAAAAEGAGPDLLRTEAAVRYNAWGGEGGRPPGAAADGSWAGQRQQPAVRPCQALAPAQRSDVCSYSFLFNVLRFLFLLVRRSEVYSYSFCRPSRFRTAGGEHDPALPPATAATGEHSCVWALLCAANHSCAPNAHAVFGGGGSLAVLRASRAIAAGEEVTVAYNEDVVWKPLRRRRSLLEKWGFHCRCARCAAEEGLPPGAREEIEAVADAVDDAPTPGYWRHRFRCAAAHDCILHCIASCAVLPCSALGCAVHVPPDQSSAQRSKPPALPAALSLAGTPTCGAARGRATCGRRWRAGCGAWRRP